MRPCQSRKKKPAKKMRTKKNNRLRVRITFGDGPTQFYQREVNAPIDDIASAISAGMVAFNQAFDDELAWIEQRSAEEAEAYSLPPAA
jgi:hypothetical protein